MKEKPQVKPGPPPEATPRALTLEDINVVWREAGELRQVSGRQLAIALQHAWSRTNRGRGDWEHCLCSTEEAVRQIENIEALLSFFVCSDSEVTMDSEAFGAIQESLREARVLAQTAFRRQHQSAFMVEIREPGTAKAA
jgi:hypothetical protein